MLEDNQIQPTEELDYILPDDYEEETAETSEVEQEEQVEQAQPFKWDDLEIKYLHETKKLGELNPEEAKALLQKGYNHDRLLEKNKAYEEKANQLSEYEKAAKAYGYSNANDFIMALNNQMLESRAEANGTDVEFERRAYELLQKEEKINAFEAEQNRKSQQEADINSFIAENPTVDVANLPQSVLEDALKVGIKLAYTKYENQQLKARMAQLEQSNKNLKQAPITGTTGNGGDGTQYEDDFLSGLLGG